VRAQTPARFGMPLTDRELTVLGLAAQGLANVAIGSRLFVAESTVKTHLRRISLKLGALSRAHAVALGFELKLLVPGEPPIVARPQKPHLKENTDAS